MPSNDFQMVSNVFIVDSMVLLQSSSDLHLISAVLAFRNTLKHPYISWISLKDMRADESHGSGIRAMCAISVAEPFFALDNTQSRQSSKLLDKWVTAVFLRVACAVIKNPKQTAKCWAFF